jgi:hypothetical protein
MSKLNILQYKMALVEDMLAQGDSVDSQPIVPLKDVKGGQKIPGYPDMQHPPNPHHMHRGPSNKVGDSNMSASQILDEANNRMVHKKEVRSINKIVSNELDQMQEEIIRGKATGKSTSQHRKK